MVMIQNKIITPFFSYDDLRIEIARKIRADAMPSKNLSEALLCVLTARDFEKIDVDRIKELIGALDNVGFDAVYENYLNHPIRVAVAFINDLHSPGYAQTVLALCHNFRELDREGLVEIEQEFVPDEMRICLDLLNTDRSRELDPNYQVSYYDGIEGYSESLMLLKAHDKLDNFLSYVLYDLDKFHWDVVYNHVLPRICKTYPILANYLNKLLPFILRDEIKDDFRANMRTYV
jgi:hypothetical protein